METLLLEPGAIRGHTAAEPATAIVHALEPVFMRPIALPGLTLTLMLPLTLPLAGCGDTWWNPPFTGGFNPHLPVVDSDNMRRAMGQASSTAALESEPGDVWPGPLPPTPTLRDLEGQNGIGSAAQQPNYGTSALPAPNRSGSPPAPGYTPQTPSNGSGQVIPLSRGQAVTTGGGAGYQTTTTPGGGSAIVVPNGNGTSTVIHSDGRIETIPTPK